MSAAVRARIRRTTESTGAEVPWFQSLGGVQGVINTHICGSRVDSTHPRGLGAGCRVRVPGGNRESVTTFFTGSSAPSARCCAAGGAGAPSSRIRYSWPKPPTRCMTMCTAAPGVKGRSLRDGLWPPLTPDAAEQECWLSGRWLSLAYLGRVPHVCPRCQADCNSRTPGIAALARFTACPAFATRRSGVRIPSAPPSRDPVSPVGTPPWRRIF